MLQQNQFNASKPLIIPPCAQKYIAMQCPAVDVRTLCDKGAQDTVSTISGTITLLASTQTVPPSLPNMYEVFSTLTLGGYLEAALTVTFDNLGYPSLGLNYLRPLQVEIYNYTYFNGSDVLSSLTGDPLATPDSDYLGATGGTFYFVFVLANVDNTTAAAVQEAVNDPYFSNLVANIGGYASAIALSSDPTLTYEAKPYLTFNSAPGSVSWGSRAINVVSLCIIAAVLCMSTLG
jgi:hypothetical protein